MWPEAGSLDGRRPGRAEFVLSPRALCGSAEQAAVWGSDPRKRGF